MKVGIFDSGQGGLTVLKELTKIYPNNEYIFLGDSLNIPYGEKTKEELMTLSQNIINFLIEKDVELIIIACGTVSSNCYNELKKLYNIPIYDILSPTLMHLKEKNLDNIGVIATPMSIKSEIFQNNTPNIIAIPCPKFVPFIENEQINTIEMEKAIHEYLDNQSIDNLVLGCTHYPLIKDKINEVMNKTYKFIDMGQILASKLKLTNNSKRSIRLYFTKLNENIKNTAIKLFGNVSIEEVLLCQNFPK